MCALWLHPDEVKYGIQKEDGTVVPLNKPEVLDCFSTDYQTYYDPWTGTGYRASSRDIAKQILTFNGYLKDEKEKDNMSFYADNHDYGNEGVSYSNHTETAEITVSTTGTDFKCPTTTGKMPNCTYTRQGYLDMLAAKKYVNDKYGWGGTIGVYDPKPAIEKFKNIVLHGFHKKRRIIISTDDTDEYSDHYETHDSTWLEGNEFPDLIKKVIFSGPCTIVIWNDDSKTIVKCKKGEKFDPEKGIAMAVLKKLFMGSSTRMSKWLKKVMEDGDIYVEEE